MVTGGNRATAHSPKREMSPFELARYLDYCTEMLSLVAKVAALYAEAFRDPVVIGQVNEMEQLSTNLSGKIWQKIVILQQIEDAAEASRERRADHTSRQSAQLKARSGTSLPPAVEAAMHDELCPIASREPLSGVGGGRSELGGSRVYGTLYGEPAGSAIPPVRTAPSQSQTALQDRPLRKIRQRMRAAMPGTDGDLTNC